MSGEQGSFRLTRKGLFMAWRMSEGANYVVAKAQTDAAYTGLGHNDDPTGEFAAAFIARHPENLQAEPKP